MPGRRSKESLFVCWLAGFAFCAWLDLQTVDAQEVGGPRTPGAAPMPWLSQHSVDRWDDRAGLQQLTIQALAQATDGYLWLGTTDGLVRFDGNRFVLYDGRTHPDLEFAYFWALIADRDGGLWGATEFSGVMHLDEGRLTRYDTTDGVPSNDVRVLLQDRRDRIWLGSSGGLARIENGRVTVLQDSALKNQIVALAEDSAGVIWVSVLGRLGTLSGDRFVAVTDTLGLAALAWNLRAGVRGGMWVSVSNRLSFHSGAGESVSVNSAGLGVITDVAQDAYGDLWIAGDHGIARSSDNEVQVMDRSHGPPGVVYSLQIDREGSVWAGTAGDGLVRVRATPFIPVGMPEGLSGRAVSSIVQDREGAIWIGTYDGGVTIRTDSSTRTLSAASGELIRNSVYDIAETSDGSVWIATGAGASRIRNGRVEIYPAGSFPGQVRQFVEDSSGQLWVGTNRGITTVGSVPARSYTAADGLAGDIVVDAVAARDGSLWIAMVGGVSRLRDGRITTYEPPVLPDGVVSRIYEDSRGVVWAGTRGGLVRFDGDRVFSYTGEHGLCAPSISTIGEDRQGRLWLGGGEGIYFVKRAELDALAAGRIERLTCPHMYTRLSGLRTPTVGGETVLADDGRLWFSTSDGAAIIDPAEVTAMPAAPPVVIESVRSGDRSYSGQSLILPQDTRNLRVTYTALSFVGSDRIRFRYMLEGVDETWVEAGQQRTALYNSVPPGRHVFRVMAATASGQWPETATDLDLYFEPRIHETLWFRLGVVALLSALMILAYRWRTSALQEKVERHRRAERRYRDAFENTTDAIFLTDMQGRITDLNGTAARLTGRTLADVEGRHVNELISGLSDTDASGALLPSKDAKPLGIVTREGETVPVDVSTHVVDFGAGPVGVQVVALDRRERLQLEQQLRQSQRMEAVGHLAAGIAHDFNNLLTVIRGNSALLLDRPDLTTSRPDLEEILHASERGAQLTRQLLTYGKQEVVQARVVDLNDIMLGVKPLISRLIPKDITIVCAPASEPAGVHADAGHMEQVLMNLALNARDAMPDGGHLEIGITVDADVVRLRVVDTGTGMSEDVQQHMFDPFFTTKEQGKGIGLGLFTVYNLVRQSGGEIRCSSTPAVGTSMTMALPHRALPAAAPTFALPAQTRGVSTATILVAEDDAAVRTVVCRMLRRRGYTLLVGSNGREALSLAAQHDGHIDLLLTDMMMPELGGFGLYQELRVVRPEMPVLFMSGYTNDDAVRKGVLAEQGAFIGKPFTADALIAAIEKLLSGGGTGHESGGTGS